MKFELEKFLVHTRILIVTETYSLKSVDAFMSPAEKQRAPALDMIRKHGKAKVTDLSRIPK